MFGLFKTQKIKVKFPYLSKVRVKDDFGLFEGVVKSYEIIQEGVIFPKFKVAYRIKVHSINGHPEQGLLDAYQDNMELIEQHKSGNVTPLRRD